MTTTRLRRAIAGLATAAIVVAATIEWVLVVLRPESGPLGIVQIIAPHLALIGLVLVPLALLERTRVLAIGVVALGLVTAIRFGGNWISLPAAPPPSDASRLEVVTWNLEVGSRPGVDSAAMIRAHPADIVALQELRPEAADAIEADAELTSRYPYRELVPRADVGGMGLLSRTPISEPTFGLDPILQTATIDLGGGRRLALVNAHPFHAELELLGSMRLPIGLDPAQRNADLDAIRRRIDDLEAGGMPVVMLGDLNTTDSEPAFDRFVAGRVDVHAGVGLGTGWTWRPIRFEFLGLGLIRIDHVITSPSVRPLGIGEVCPAVGDHCLVHAGLALFSRP